MGSGCLPPGFRFHPTDDELVGYYLKRQVDGLGFELQVIPVIDLYKFDPWELPGKSFLPKRDMEWFFFCPRDRKYPNGSRTNRATNSGYWKATGKDRKIICQSSVTGYRKTLVFYCGRAPSGDRTDWVMHEYRLCDEIPQGSSGSQGAFALCRVIKKNDNTVKGSDSTRELLSKSFRSSSSLIEFTATSSIDYETRNSSPYEDSVVEEPEPTSAANNLSSLCLPSDLILDSSKDYSSTPGVASQCEPPYGPLSPMNDWNQYIHHELSSNSTCSSFMREVDIAEDLGYQRFWGNDEFPYEDNYFPGSGMWD